MSTLVSVHGWMCDTYLKYSCESTNREMEAGKDGGRLVLQEQAFVIALFIASWLRAMAHMKYYQDDDTSQPNSKL